MIDTQNIGTVVAVIVILGFSITYLIPLIFRRILATFYSIKYTAKYQTYFGFKTAYNSIEKDKIKEIYHQIKEDADKEVLKQSKEN